MLAAVRSAAVLGIEAYDVTVEVDVAAGLPAWTIVGLASSAVKEARERVTAAITNSGFALPSRRVTVNLSPESEPRARRALCDYSVPAPMVLRFVLDRPIALETRRCRRRRQLLRSALEKVFVRVAPVSAGV
jgi:hypothetical protein